MRGRRRPVVGLISMDQVVVDVGDDRSSPARSPRCSAPATHGEPTVAEWAGWAGTIEHEIVTGIGAAACVRTVARRPAESAVTIRVAVIGGGAELRARGVPGLGRVGGRRARPGGVRRRAG